ncbi:MAG: DUF1456 family protein [Oligoflexia bacterium]|nr:DUF1456 family protein [Oligoflexia bacterium]
MQTNDVLRRLRYALDLSDHQLAKMISHRGEAVAPPHVTRLLWPEAHPEMVECSFDELERALDGLIIARRGPPDPSRPRPPLLGRALSNNQVLKKLRIALEFKEQDMLQILAEGGLPISGSELGALFRKPAHKHYRECGDQLLRAFFKGLTLRMRG